ncbi:hypothetical protein ACWDYJ_16530 [Streptomyces sp. NPDC003042]
MDGSEAWQVHTAMRQYGIPGLVAPETPQNPEGSWRVYDVDDPDTRQDITAYVLAEVATARGRQPERGFVIAR